MGQPATLPGILKLTTMADEVIKEKVYCHDNSNSALMAALMNGKSDPMAMAAMMNGGMGNQWLNNPFLYLIFLAMFGGNGFGWGNNRGQGLQDAEIQAKLSALGNQASDNHNNDLVMGAIRGNDADIRQLQQTLNCDANQLQTALCNVRNAITEVGGQVGFSAEKVINAANLGNQNIIQQLKDCCCATQQNIIKMGYESQLGQKDIVNAMQTGFDRTNTGLERGFSAIGYQMATDKCDIVRSAQDNTQRIIDTLNNHWSSDLQLRLNRAELELSQQRQNAELIAALKTTTTTTT